MVDQAEPASQQASQLFDLQNSEGVNESERILTELCRKSFLRLWSQTNVYTDEGFKDGKGATKELCDALIIFGNDVIIFSDKHIIFQADKELTVSWPRWYKRAVVESAKQLHGAKGWLQRFPERAYLDPQCTRRLPVAMPPAQDVRFHLVAVTRGTRDAVITHHGGSGQGSLLIDSSVIGKAYETEYFTIGQPLPGKQFVHVFDEVSIELVLNELDTAPDFIDYLNKRALLLGRPEIKIIAPGEEELLASFLLNMNDDDTEHVFINLPAGEPIPDAILFAADHFNGLHNKPGYIRKKHADRISYEVWDRLIERFIQYGDPKLLHEFVEQPAGETEQGLRLMAAESRFRRRMLSQMLVGALERVEPGERLARLAYGGVADETVYVFVIVPRKKAESYAEYRSYRVGILHAYVRTARLKAPLGTVFVGIALDNPHKDEQGGSEDLIVWTQQSWTDDELEELESMRKELGLWGAAMEYSRYRQDEFPQHDQFNPIQRISDIEEMPSAAKRTVRREKNMRKMRKTSKRRNRR
jgi:hypothetical protein